MPGAEVPVPTLPPHVFSLAIGSGLALRLREPHLVPDYATLLAENWAALEALPADLFPRRPDAAAARAHTDAALADFEAGTGWECDLLVAGEPAGAVRMRRLGRPAGNAEIGFWLSSAHEDDELAVAVLGGLLRHLFLARGVDRVYLVGNGEDQALGRVASGLGFRREAVMRRAGITLSGRPADRVVYGLLRGEAARTPLLEDGGAAVPSRFAMPVDAGLELALPEARDAAELSSVAARTREQLLPWMPWADDISLGAQLGFVTGRALPAVRVGDGFEALIVEHGRVSGMAGVHDVRPVERSGALGYWLDAARQGEGIVTRCARAIVERCFWSGACAGRPFERLEILAGVDNVRSRAVAERLGFKFEGAVRRDQVVGGRHLDMAVYSQLRSEWAGPGGWARPAR